VRLRPRISPHQRLRVLFFLVVGVGTLGLTFGMYAFGFLDQFERQTVDERFQIRGAHKAPADIVVVKVDDVTFDDLALQWPFPRSKHAQLLDRLRLADPKAVVVDIQFTEQETPRCPSQACADAAIADDNALLDATARLHGKVVLSTTEVGPGGTTGIFGGGGILQKIGARAGWGNFRADKDGPIRKVSYEVQKLKSLSIVAAEIALGHPIKKSQLPGGRAWIDYVGPPGTIRSYSYSRVLNGKVPASAFKNKIVVVGASAPVLQDIHDTSFGTGMSGPELQANAIETAVKGFPLRSVPTWLDILMIILLGAAAPLLGLRFGPILGTAATVVLAAAFAGSAHLAFESGWILSFVYPLTALALSTVGAIVVHYLVVAVERERVRDLFSRFVPDGVVDQVLAQAGGDLRLGGKKQVATVLFSDLRGFTASAEHMDAADVIRVLNHYLGDMTEAILGHGGTLVSYMGDGIYALFGAPIELEDHADRALAASREMVEVRLPRFNTWMRGAGFGSGFQMGVGLNTGPIMSGNVGHERRLEYTAVGDSVNTASRIEGLTKGTGFSIFVSETTYDALQRPPADLTYYDEVEIRGRRNTLKLWGTSPKQELEAAPEPEPMPESEPVEAPAHAEPI
jgi:adenylate cyclase